MDVKSTILNLAAIFILLLMVCFIVFVYLDIYYFIFLRVPALSTNNRAIRKVLQNIDFKGKKKFYDLGAGNGKLISRIADKYPQLECVGIEYNITAHYCAKFRNLFSDHKVIYRRINFFKVDLSDADIVYAYLFPGIMNRLESKFASELKNGAVVIANSFPLKSKDPKATIRGKIGALDTLYVYEY